MGTEVEICQEVDSPLDRDAPAEHLLRLHDRIKRSSAILRIPSRFDRSRVPLLGGCVGFVIGVLGVPVFALTPWRLHQALLRLGAESVDPGQLLLDMLPSAEIVEFGEPA